MEELVPEWGLRRDKGSWFQRKRWCTPYFIIERGFLLGYGLFGGI